MGKNSNETRRLDVFEAQLDAARANKVHNVANFFNFSKTFS